MKIKVFYPNEKGNIELTKEKLEAILTEVYNEGYRDGRNSNGFYYNTLSTVTTPYVSSINDGICGAVAKSNSDNSYTFTTTDDVCLISSGNIAEKISAIETNCTADSAVAALEESYPKSIVLEYVEG